MSSMMNMSLGALKELLNSSKNAANEYVNTDAVLSYASSSLGFAREHKLEIVGAGVAGYVAWYLAKVWYDQRTFKRLGIATPDYKFFFGHFPETVEKGYSEALRQWTEKHGKVYGIYEGHSPLLIVSDADMVQEIYIKQFSNFSARRKFQFSFEDDDPRESLFFSSKSRWRRQRNIMNPTFTAARLRELTEFIKVCSDRFMTQIDKHAGQSLAVVNYSRAYTMDVVWNCAFGVDIDCQKDTNNKFFRKGVETFEELSILRWNFLVATYFPEARSFINAVSFLVTLLFSKITESRLLIDPFAWLIFNINQIFDKRFALKTTRKDFVNMLLENHDEQVDKSQDKLISKDAEATNSAKKMTFDEIKLNMVGFLVAGFETTSGAINFCLYMMTKYPDELRKLQEEVDSHFKNTQTPIDYDSIIKLEYLDMFIKEVLRFYPLGNYVTGRRCTNPCTINGISIPENLSIAVDAKTLHFDPEHWGADAQEFNPLRFSPEIKRHPAVYLPFGLGPRMCIGMRFALLEVKLTLAKLLLKYDVVATPETPKELFFDEISGTMTPTTPIMVALEPRK